MEDTIKNGENILKKTKNSQIYFKNFNLYFLDCCGNNYVIPILLDD